MVARNNRKYKIILTDDDAEDRHLFKEAIQVIKHVDLSIAKNGIELMNILEEMPSPDVIFLDLKMIHKDGHDCLKEIKTDPKLKNIPVVILSGSTNPHHVESAFENGANLYIAKPSSFELLRNTIRKVLSLESAHYIPQAPKEKFVYSRY